MSQSSGNVQAIDPPEAETRKEHHWLQKLIGEWVYEFDVPAHGEHPARKATGTENVRSLGGIWIVAEGQGEATAGTPDTTLITLGYDPLKSRFVGTWVGSMMPYLWVYDGELDAEGRVLTLNSSGPSMAGDGTTAQYQDVIEIHGDDRRTLTARAQGSDGAWQEIMRMSYRRKR